MRSPSARQLTLVLDAGQRPELPEPAREADALLDRGPALAERELLLGRAAELASRLSDLLDERVRLTLTDNSSTMVSFRRARGLVAFRVHRMFAEAPAEVVRALAEYASRGRGRSGSVIDRYVRENEERVKHARVARQARGLTPDGNYHQLDELYAQLNREQFGGKVVARIGWGREPPQRRRRSIKMGTYFHDAAVIRIHPGLDRAEVPAFFVRFIVFHEMLHQAVPPVTRGGRRISHTAEFRKRERAYPEYALALAWERKHLGLLLGKPQRARSFDPDDPLA